MAEDIINKIKNAESAAKETVEGVKKENQQKLDDAVASAKKRLQDANVAKQKAVKEAQSRADKDAQVEIKSLNAEYDSKISSMREVAGSKTSEAVKLIISKV